VTRQETTFTQTISRNQRLQTKTPEKEHVNMASQSEYARCFETLSWFSPTFSGALVNVTVLTLLLKSVAEKKTFQSRRFS